MNTQHRWRTAVVRRWRAAVAQPEAGYNPLEAAIITPIIIVFTMLIVQFALLWHGRHVAEAAAQAAARSAAAYTSTAALGQADGASYLAQVAPHLLSLDPPREWFCFGVLKWGGWPLAWENGGC